MDTGESEANSTELNNNLVEVQKSNLDDESGRNDEEKAESEKASQTEKDKSESCCNEVTEINIGECDSSSMILAIKPKLTI